MQDSKLGMKSWRWMRFLLLESLTIRYCTYITMHTCIYVQDMHTCTHIHTWTCTHTVLCTHTYVHMYSIYKNYVYVHCPHMNTCAYSSQGCCTCQLYNTELLVYTYICVLCPYSKYIHYYTHMYSSKVGAHFELQLLIGHFFKDSI